MARSGRGAAPAYLLLLLAFLPSRESQPGLRAGDRDPDVHTSVVSKNSLKDIMKLLDQRIQVLHQKNLMHEHEITEKQGRPFTEHMNLVKDVPEPLAYQLLLLNQILQSLKARSAHRDNSQSTINEQSETSVKELENILNDLNEETAKVQNTPPADESKAQMLMEDEFPLEKSQGPETDSSEKKDKTLMESFPEEGLTVPASSETSLIYPLKTTLPQNIRTEVTNEDVKDARRFEFFEKYEGIQDKKRAKAADLKELLKHIIIACVAVSSLILAVIVLVHIYNSLFVKKQEPIMANANTGKKEESDKKEELIKNEESNKHEESEESDKNKIIPLQPKTPEYNTVEIENHNNNNCSPPAIFLSTDGEDVTKPLEIQSISSPSCPAKQTDLIPHVESLEESPNYSTHKNFKLQSRAFKLNNTSYNSLEQYSTSRNQDYERRQEKDIISHRKKSDHRISSRNSPKSTEPKRAHTTHLSKHQYYNNSNQVHDSSSDVFNALDTSKNIDESKMSHFDGTECACFQHHKCGSSTDSYSD
ncbi:uncharacterized protein PHA67_020016 isoform 2-T2 [Liasis olivaceus]